MWNNLSTMQKAEMIKKAKKRESILFHHTGHRTLTTKVEQRNNKQQSREIHRMSEKVRRKDRKQQHM